MAGKGSSRPQPRPYKGSVTWCGKKGRGGKKGAGPEGGSRAVPAEPGHGGSQRYRRVPVREHRAGVGNGGDGGDGGVPGPREGSPAPASPPALCLCSSRGLIVQRSHRADLPHAGLRPGVLRVSGPKLLMFKIIY